ncbi:putative D-ribose-binding protein component of ABC transporter [Pseudomonas sp. FH4]|jgi:ribose transport system substrate-binding protein|uniref:Monosaccharide ABC transporter substrate-binding protein, CUT2 family n=1 Tax=Pseudomonas brenneri TaxID=129817 RepID=A0A5B2UWY3_9PSED|nr:MULTISPECIES: sugar ABC transporter substrate-binding protein [Pseudomonas]KAA6171382.1 sugar ABC transporter substrate-binding protein [Pseudomonas marginalis]ETK17546.1 putative D-ribose-binding protein component of ABC transporter [Pseudomonas sp. FH4]KAA2231673.1 sugar ABC transporter substrate-binding protein [Pseudomonas brenneri]MBF8003072.1 sugar ABC transporter substrate-binding protein [Pseudomonas brenneri]MBT9304990.1 sugar ABC transporter substrate-binding protein [Pseudomonas 
MFITKKLLLATAFAAATLGSVGTTWAKDLTIGLAVANLQADFFNQIKQSVEAEGKAKGIKVITVDAQGNSSTQVSQIEDLITRQIDVLIYIPAGATAAGVPVKAAKAAGIPVIAVDRNAPDAPGDTFIASDSVAGAKALAEYVGKVTEGKGRIAILQGQLGTTPENDRAKGFAEGLKAFPELTVVAEQPAEWAQDKGFAVAQDLLQRDPNITVFFGRADAMALGAAQAVKVGNLDHKVVVVGFDGDVAGLKAVQNGVLNATMTQQTQKMGRLAVASAIDLKAGKAVPKEQLLETVLTTKDNVAPFLQQHP